jgi:hypothetical protein
MSLIATCPFCAVKVRLSQNAVGASVECPRCHSFFTAAEDDLVPESSRNRDPVRPPLFPPQASTKSTETFAATITAADAPGSDPEPTDEQAGHVPKAPSSRQRVTIVVPTAPTRAPTVEPWEATALLMGSLALVTATVKEMALLTIPLAVAGLVLAAATPLIRARPSKLGVFGPVAGGLLALGILLCIWVRPDVFGVAWVRGSAVGPEPEKAYFVPKGTVKDKPQPLGPDDVVDAQLGAWRRGDLQVRVVSLEMMQAAKPAQGTGPGASKTPPQLAVRLKVTNIGGAKTIPFAGWGKSDSTAAGAAVILRDGQSREYQLRGNPTTPVKPSSKGAASPPTSLGPRAFAEEVLLFDSSAQAAEELFLDLSQTPLGMEGRLKFKIARTTMVRT